jgi:mediator of RNA polymerase II transcription subunit 17, fungi type
MDSLLLPLRPTSSKDPAASSLAFIPQINAQRRGFRHISEASLLEELATRSSTHNITNDIPDDEPTDEYNEKRKELYERKAEMQQQVGEAHNSALMALDFISLLLSVPGGKGEQSMSPVLKEHVPIASMGAQVIERTADESKRDISLVAKGWKLESFNSAADSLLRSSARLESEIQQETSYWEQVLLVKEKGWTMCRMPGEKHTLGVKYGFREASSTYRDRGVAALRRDEGGKITLDHGLLATPARTVRVQIQSQGEITGASIFTPSAGESINEQIFEARNALFDEELFFELTREARALISHGVEIRNGTIHIPYDPDKSKVILISLEPVADLSAPSPSSQETEKESQTASSILLILRLLLSHIHAQTHRRRSVPQPPLSLKPAPKTLPSIIQPIISYIQHSTHLSTTLAYVNTLFSPLRSAGLDYMIRPLPYATTSLTPPTTPSALLSALTSPLESSVSIVLPSSSASSLSSFLSFSSEAAASTLTLTLRTSLAPPTQGTEFSFTTANLPPESDIPTRIPRITSAEEVQALLSRILSFDLLTTISTLSKSQSQPHSQSPGKANRPAQNRWEIYDPENSELSKQVPVPIPGARRRKTREARMHVSVGDGKLGARWTWMDGHGEGGEYLWDSQAVDDREGMTLGEWLAQAGTGA